MAIVQYIGLKLGSLETTMAPLWPASGIATALIFLRGTSILFGLWVGGLFAYLSIGSPVYFSLVASSLLVFEAWLIRAILHRLGNAVMPLCRIKEMVQFIIVSGIVSLIVTQFFYNISLIYHLKVDSLPPVLLPASPFIPSLSDIGGILFFTPFYLITDSYVSKFKKIPWQKILSLCIVFITISLATAGLSFSTELPLQIFCLFLLAFCYEILRRKFGQFGVACSIGLMGVTLICLTYGNFIHFSDDKIHSFILFQFLLITLAVLQLVDIRNYSNRNK